MNFVKPMSFFLFSIWISRIYCSTRGSIAVLWLLNKLWSLYHWLKCKRNEKDTFVWKKAINISFILLFTCHEKKIDGKTEVLGVKPSYYFECCFVDWYNFLIFTSNHCICIISLFLKSNMISNLLRVVQRPESTWITVIILPNLPNHMLSYS